MRLIDADYFDKMLIDAQAKCAGRSNTFKYGFLSTVRANLERCPTVEAVPVRRGRWKGIRYIGDVVDSLVFDVWMCSECGKYHYGYKNTLTNFCPNCGADMREGEKDG